MDNFGYPTKIALIDNKNTAADGTSWTAFASQDCVIAEVHNPTGADISVRQGGAGNAVTVPALSFRRFFGVGNLANLSMRRKDTSTTQVAVEAIAYQ